MAACTDVKNGRHLAPDYKSETRGEFIERQEEQYQQAMDKGKAGRDKAAADSFRKVCNTFRKFGIKNALCDCGQFAKNFFGQGFPKTAKTWWGNFL